MREGGAAGASLHIDITIRGIPLKKFLQKSTSEFETRKIRKTAISVITSNKIVAPLRLKDTNPPGQAVLGP